MTAQPVQSWSRYSAPTVDEAEQDRDAGLVKIACVGGVGETCRSQEWGALAV